LSQAGWKAPFRWTLRCLGGLSDLVFPPTCAVCGSLVTESRRVVCQECQEGFELLRPPFCRTCGQPFCGPGDCPECRADTPPLQTIRSVFAFGGPLGEAVMKLKYGDQRQLTPFFGGLMAETAAGYWNTHTRPDWLVAVPLHPARLAARGFNQSSLLASEVGKRLSIPASHSHLIRTRATPSQSRMKTRTQRKRNVHGAFDLCPGHPFSKRHVCLVDDVVTTGATLSACAETLKAGGAASVTALTLARTVRW
jgi:ComF family protein